MPFRLTKAGGTKSHLILQSRRQVLLVVDEEGQFGVRSGLSSIYMIRMGLRLVQMRGKKLQADKAAHAFSCC